MKARLLTAGYVGVLTGLTEATWQDTPWALTAKITITAALGTALLWFLRWRAADAKARRCDRVHGQLRLRCAACRHYSCDGSLCGTCEGPCTTPQGTRPARLLVPRQHSHWLN